MRNNFRGQQLLGKIIFSRNFEFLSEKGCMLQILDDGRVNAKIIEAV